MTHVGPARSERLPCGSWRYSNYFSAKLMRRNTGGPLCISLGARSRDAWTNIVRRTFTLRLPTKSYDLQFDYVG